MAKIKLQRFQIIALLTESKKLMDFLQRTGVTELQNAENEVLIKHDTSETVTELQRKSEVAEKAFRVLERTCEIKKNILQKFSDYREIDYSEYKLISDKSDEIYETAELIISLDDKISEYRNEISKEKKLSDYYSSWLSLDIPLGSKRTANTNIFVGSFKKQLTKERLMSLIEERNPELTDVEAEIVHSEKMLTNAVFMCHKSHSEELLSVLSGLGFYVPEKMPMKTADKAKAECESRISELLQKIEDTENEMNDYKDNYENIRFLYDFYIAEADKYKAVENTGTTEKTVYITGYVPAKYGEELKFEVERRFTSEMVLSVPDYENEDVPVLIENRSFAAGVESVTNMYSPPSNKDVDPNPVMSFFYYAFFGLMLSDAGYGLLMVLSMLFAKYKLKVRGSMKKTCDMYLYCGISTVFWGTLFGGWFGDLIPTVMKNFMGIENPPSLALWLEPMNDTMDLLMYSMLFGVVHLLAGLLIRFYMLLKEKNYLGAVFDVIPVMLFAVGFAISGASFIFTVPEAIKPYGTILLAVGSVLIVLTAGRSSKNILGKLGGGLYALYNAASGYLGDILSYSRLLALCLVTGVIANVVNLLGAMPGNIIIFIIIFIVGHTINIAINLIGTYVHTNRLQYVEFFSKFYEGSGRTFTPLKINSKFFTIREDEKYE
ncbi:MAG: V-type ATP synthase subunit I [Clostridia bacterium]|nr:V-type ATP synthase subunit I [Clostridia bacterium]